MQSTSTDLRRGERLELWARGRRCAAAFRITVDGRTAYEIAAPPPYFDHFAYEHGAAGTAQVAWDPDILEISLFYSYDPATVAEEGIVVWDLSSGRLERLDAAAVGVRMRADASRPRLHFSPLSGWMNDPNGLCRVGDRYHLFYQFHPNGTDWGPMHWGHAASRDLLAWTHLPVFLHPAQNLARLGAGGGAFSGSALQRPGRDPVFFHTERLPFYDDGAGREVQRRVVPGPGLIAPAAAETVLAGPPPGAGPDFRDPRVWYDGARGAYRMALGSALDGDPAVLLYGSPDGRDWTYLGPLYRAPPEFAARGARAVECPDFFALDGHWILTMSFVGLVDPATGRHNLSYGLAGRLEDDRFVPRAEGLQELDFGTDFYALQTLADGARRLAFAWLSNWRPRPPAGARYSGEMSLPRELSASPAGRIRMRPAAEVDAAPATAAAPVPEGGVNTAGRAADVTILGVPDGLTLTGTGAFGAAFAVRCRNRRLTISVPGDDGGIRYRSQPADFRNMRIILDRGIIEVFANDGEICGTRRTRAVDGPVVLTVRAPEPSAAAASVRLFA